MPREPFAGKSVIVFDEKVTALPLAIWTAKSIEVEDYHEVKVLPVKVTVSI